MPSAFPPSFSRNHPEASRLLFPKFNWSDSFQCPFIGEAESVWGFIWRPCYALWRVEVVSWFEATKLLHAKILMTLDDAGVAKGSGRSMHLQPGIFKGRAPRLACCVKWQGDYTYFFFAAKNTIGSRLCTKWSTWTRKCTGQKPIVSPIICQCESHENASFVQILTLSYLIRWLDWLCDVQKQKACEYVQLQVCFAVLLVHFACNIAILITCNGCKRSYQALMSCVLCSPYSRCHTLRQNDRLLNSDSGRRLDPLWALASIPTQSMLSVLKDPFTPQILTLLEADFARKQLTTAFLTKTNLAERNCLIINRPCITVHELQYRILEYQRLILVKKVASGTKQLQQAQTVIFGISKKLFM